MNFTHNATKFYLLTNKPVIFSNEEGQSFEFFSPSLQEIMTNENLIYFIDFLERDIEEINKDITKKIESHYDFLHLIFSLQNQVPFFKTLSKRLLKGIQVLIPDFNFDKVFLIKDIFVNKSIFDEIVEVVFICLNKEVIIIKDSDDEFSKAEKKVKLRVQKIKESSRRENNNGGIESIIISILYQFPQYKIKDIMEMNLTTIYYIFSYIGKISNYEISAIAVGNGLIKGSKHKYFTEK